MDPQALFGLQFTLSLVVFGLVARWYVAPRLAALPLEAGLVPLFFVHALRYLPSSGFAPGQLDPRLPMGPMSQIAYGDLASAILALIAVLFLHNRWRGAIALAWAVNVLAALDWLYATFLAASNHLVTYGMGVNWYIVAYYVPILAVTHVMIFARLISAARKSV